MAPLRRPATIPRLAAAMSDVADFSLLSDDERADLERVSLAVAVGELEAWKAAYRKGWRERNEPWKRPPHESPPLSDPFKAHLDYLGGLIAGIKDLDAARSEHRVRRAVRVIERRRPNGLG
jgi:hypothetical protein